MAGVDVIGLHKIYGRDAHVLKGIDLAIDDGEFLVLVGPSGCGKSTLLRCIAGLEDISKGDLKIGERSVGHVAPKDRDVAMVFQSYALYPHMSVRDNMGFSLAIRKRPKAEIAKAVDDAARMLGLESFLDRLPKQLSGGQRQRVAIGRAIVRRPSVFLFDEPLSNLDANLRAQMRVELKKLHRQLGVTMIYVTHDQVEAMTLADRICVLEGGYARQVDSPSDIYEKPNSRFVAEFIGSPPMNFLMAELNEGARLIGEHLDIGLPRKYRNGSLPKELIIGIRPHELTLDEANPGMVEATVEVVETLGWDLHLHCVSGSASMIAQLDARSAGAVRAGDCISFRVDPQAIKLFDPSTEKAIVAEVG